MAWNDAKSNAGGGDSGTTPTPPAGTLDPNEMLKRDPVEDKIVGTGDTNTDTEVNFGSKTITTTGLVNAGSGTFRLGAAHDIASAGENVITKNLVSGLNYYPVWIEQDENRPIARLTVGTEQELIQEASKADILINPSWQSDPIVDWRVVQLTVEVDTTITNAVFSVTKGGADYYTAKLGTLTANVETIVDLTAGDNVPAEAFLGDIYIVSLTSEDGDVRAKGSTTNALPFFKVGYFEMVKKLSITEDDYAIESVATSLTSGGLITQATATTINVAAGVGRIVSFNAINEPAVTRVDFNEQLGIALPNIATELGSRVAIDITGAVSVIDVQPTQTSNRDLINLGIVSHPDGSITRILNSAFNDKELYAQFVDNLQALGVTKKSGLAVIENADLTFTRTAGELEAPGAGIEAGERGENIVSLAAESPANFSRVLGIIGDIETANTTLLDPAFYDDGTGTKAAIGAPSAQSTIMYVYQSIAKDSPTIVVSYGQVVYATLNDAIVNAATEKVVVPDILQGNSNLIARIAIRSDATDLTDPLQAEVLGGVKFGTGLDGVGFGNVSGGGDFFGPASSIQESIVTFADATGKSGKSASDVKVEAGLISRATLNADLDISPNGTGVIKVGDSHFASGETLNYPTVDGEAGDVITTDSLGNLTIQADNFELITTSTTIEKDNKFLYTDSSAGDITLTLGDNPRTGERKLFWVGDNTNKTTLISANPSFPIAPVPPTAEANVQGLWTLNSDFIDRFTTDRDLTNSGTGGSFVPATVNGNAVNAFDFEQTAYLEAVASDYRGILGGTARSFTTWYQANAGTPIVDENIVAWGEDIPSGGFAWEMEFRGTQGYMWVNNRNASKRWNMATLEAVNLFDGNMHHIAVTQSNSSMGSVTLYIDGVAIAHNFLDTFPNNNTNGNVVYRIGANWQGGAILNGRLYDSRLFNRGLNATEVTEVINENILGGVTFDALSKDMVFSTTYNGTEWVFGLGTETIVSDNTSRIETLETNKDRIESGAASAVIDGTGAIEVRGDEVLLSLNSTVGSDSAVGFKIDDVTRGFIGFDDSENNLAIKFGGNATETDGIEIRNLGVKLGTRVAINTPTEGGKALIVKGIDANADTYVEFINNGTGNTKLFMRADDAGSPYIQFQQTGNLRAHIGYDNASQTLCIGNQTFPNANLTLDQSGKWAFNGVPTIDDIAVDFLGSGGVIGCPVLTTVQLDAISSRGGCLAYDSTLDQLVFFSETLGSYRTVSDISVVARALEQNNIALSGVFQTINSGTFDYYDVDGSPFTPTFTGGTWTVDATGVYQFNIRGWAFTGTGTENQARFYVSVNGSNYSTAPNAGIDTVSKNGSGLNLSGQVKLTAGDVVFIGYSILSGTGWELDGFTWDIARQS